MGPEESLRWESLIVLAYSLGVRSFTAIKTLAADAGVDVAAFAEAMQPKWDALVADIARAAGQQTS